MPRYNYECDDCGFDYDVFCASGEQPAFVKCKVCGKRADRNWAAQISATRSGWPIHSEALAVHPDQISEQKSKCEKFGVRTDFDNHGCPVFRDRGHRREYLRMEQCYDRDGGYGDG